MSRLSVTEILGLAGVIDTTWYTEVGRDRGTAVHQATVMVDEGDLEDSWLQSTDEQTRKRVEAYIRFRSEVDCSIIKAEFEVVHPTYNYVGHPDRLLTINGQLAVLDIKPPNAERWHGAQLAGYQRAIVSSMDDVGIPTRYNLYLKDNGTYKLEPRRKPLDWKRFHAALIMAQWNKEARS